MKSVDFKSMVIGLLLGICVMFVLGASYSSSNIDRYRISVQGTQNNFYVIDTATGRVWNRYSNSRGSYWGSPEEWDKKAGK